MDTGSPKSVLMEEKSSDSDESSILKSKQTQQQKQKQLSRYQLKEETKSKQLLLNSDSDTDYNFNATEHSKKAVMSTSLLSPEPSPPLDSANNTNISVINAGPCTPIAFFKKTAHENLDESFDSSNESVPCLVQSRGHASRHRNAGPESLSLQKISVVDLVANLISDNNQPQKQQQIGQSEEEADSDIAKSSPKRFYDFLYNLISEFKLKTETISDSTTIQEFNTKSEPLMVRSFIIIIIILVLYVLTSIIR